MCRLHGHRRHAAAGTQRLPHEAAGAEVRGVSSGSCTLKDAINEAMRDWVTNVRTTHYLLGSVLGAHPYPPWSAISTASSDAKPAPKSSKPKASCQDNHRLRRRRLKLDRNFLRLHQRQESRTDRRRSRRPRRNSRRPRRPLPRRIARSIAGNLLVCLTR